MIEYYYSADTGGIASRGILAMNMIDIQKYHFEMNVF